MKKRLLALLLSAIILAGLINANGLTASAAGAPVAKVGSTEYATIDEAVANWTAGSMLTLLADVTLSDVIKLKSTEHHIIDLGTYTMTAASGKHAIEITCEGRSSESSALTVNADPNTPGGISAAGMSCIYYRKSGTTKDRPIVRINNGVFNGSYAINIYSSNSGTNCPTVQIYGGTFNGNVSIGKGKLIVSNGTFNGWINCTGDSTAYRQISGGKFKSWQFMTADATNKFWVGTSKDNYNVGVYVDDSGYLVVGGPVITEPGTELVASSANYGGWSSYLKNSSAATNQLYYTSIDEAIADNNKATSSITVYQDIDLTGKTYKGTIIIPASRPDLKITCDAVSQLNIQSNTPDNHLALYTKTSANGIEEREYYFAPYSINDSSMGTVAAADPSVDGCSAIVVTPAAGHAVKEIKVYETGNESNTIEVLNSQFVKPNFPISISIEFEKVYTVTFDYGDAAQSDSKTVPAGSKLDMHAPAFEGYIFNGWFADDAYSVPYVFPAEINSDITVYAKFYPIEKEIDSLEDAVTKLDSSIKELDTKLNDKTSISALADAVSKLEDSIEAAKEYADAQDESLKEILEAADDILNTAISELTNSVTALESGLIEANGKINANSNDIAALKNDVDTLNTWKTEAQIAIDALENLIEVQGQDISQLQDSVVALQRELRATNDKIAVLENAISDLEGRVDDLETVQAELESALAALQDVVATKADTATLNAKVQELSDAIAAAEAAAKAYTDQNSAQLSAAVSAAKAEAVAAAEVLVNSAKTELQAAIDTKADTAAVNTKVQELSDAIAAAEAAAKAYTDQNTAQLSAAVSAAKAEAVAAAEVLVNSAKTELQTAIDTKASTAAVNAKVQELSNAIVAAENTAKTYTDQKVSDLVSAIAAAKSEAVTAAEALVNSAKVELQTAIDTKADSLTVNAAIANLQNAISVLEKTKDSYIAADAALKAELEAAINKAKQEAIDAAKGSIPFIGENGNWWIGETDTGVSASGIQGEAGKDGITPQLRINSSNIWEVSYDNGVTWKSLNVSAVGSSGTNGITPKLRVSTNNIWEVSYDGGNSWESLGISAVGVSGINGKDGKDGLNGRDGKDGQDGKDGKDGKDGITPRLQINPATNLWEVSYDNGNSWESLGVNATGKDGTTPQLRINESTGMWEVSYDEGNSWTSTGFVAVGKDGKDGKYIVPTVLSGISLASSIMLVALALSKKKVLF